MKKIFLILAAVAMFASCKSDFLDKTPLDKLSEDAVFNSPELAEAYVNALYTVLPDPFQEGNISCITDEGYFRYGGTATRWRYDGRLNPDNVMYAEEGGLAHNTRVNTLNIWNRAYQYIYRMNSYIKYMTDKGSAMDKANFDRLLGEVYYLRAWAYYNLIQRYAGVPLITEPQDLQDKNFAATRALFDDCVDFILSDLEKAEAAVPTKAQGRLGRINKDIVQALRARVTLLAASKLYNDPASPAGTIFKGAYSEAKWERAYNACKAVATNPNYELDDKYSDTWKDKNSKELIWAKYFVTTETDNKAQLLYSVLLYKGWTSMEPAQAITLDYETTNGKKIYEEGNELWDPQHPYANRDPRFYYTIATPFSNYGVTTASGYTDNKLELTLTKSGEGEIDWTKDDGKTGWTKAKDVWDANTWTGLELNKWYDPQKPITEKETTSPFYPWFRLAEFYLNFAECAYRMKKEDECREYINKVRARADVNMPPVTESGENLWDRLVNERRIEMAFEFTRYFDVRRWMVADFVENVPLCGTRTHIYTNTTTGQNDTIYRMPRLASEVNKTHKYYNLDATTPGLEGKTVQTYKWLGKEYVIDFGECIFNAMTSTARVFYPEKNYLEPIPRNEIIKSNYTIEQNPNYE